MVNDRSCVGWVEQLHILQGLVVGLNYPRNAIAVGILWVAIQRKLMGDLQIQPQL